MAFLFSPVSQDVLEGPFQPRPRHAFLMLHSGERRSRLDREMDATVCAALDEAGLTPLRAADVGGVGDYLDKIVGLIRGCGLGVAIFSEATPPPTLANIFFEVGLCLMFGRPVVLAKTAEALTPSDFVRTEWVAQYEDEGQFQANLSRTLETITQHAPTFYRTIGAVALEADEVDYELAFERYMQAVLIAHAPADLRQIERIYADLRDPSRDDRLHVVRRRLRTSVGQFLKMVPRPAAEAPP